MVAWAAVLLAAACAVFVYGLRPLRSWRLRHIPGPRGLWLLGNALDFTRAGAHAVFQPWAAHHGPVFQASLASWSAVVVADPKLARKVLRVCPERPPVQPISEMSAQFRWQMSRSLLFANGALWQRLRPSWHPLFTPKQLDGYRPVMEERAALLVRQLHAALSAGQPVVDIHAAVSDLAFDVVARAGLGWPADAQTGGCSGTGRAAVDWQGLRQDAAAIFQSAGGSAWVRLYGAVPQLLPLIRAVNWLLPDPLMDQMLSARRRLMKHLAAFLSSTKAEPFMPQLQEHLDGLASRPGALSEVQLQQALLMLLAGYDTTSSTLAFACHLLSQTQHTGVQQALAAEVAAAAAERRDALSLPMLDAVVKETLRLLPPGYTTARRAHRELDVGGFRVPRGQWLMLPIYAIHRDDGAWGPDANRFRPGRWLEPCSPETAEARQRAYLPFGDGGRHCPGQRFALQELKITLFHIFREFAMEAAAPDEPLKLRTSITMAPADGVRVRLRSLCGPAHEPVAA